MDLGGKLDWRTRVAWLVSCMPEMLKSVAWDMFVLFYYSQVIGLRGDLLGVVLALILIADALIDPYAGTVSDRLRGAWLGRRHTPMVLAIVPFAVGFIAVFSPPSGLSQLGIAAWLTVAGLIARLGISFYTIPALAMGAELSRDPRERATDRDAPQHRQQPRCAVRSDRGLPAVLRRERLSTRRVN